ncbi:MAG: hypothetical protein WC253_08030 [Sulfurovaceae bacterium]|nr:hypothetical protein [Sulfurovaceae bacterium]
MRVGLYLFASITFLIVVAVLAFLANQGNYDVNLFGLHLSLPVAVWVILPVAILLILSVLHMFYYSTKNFFLLRKWHKDALSLEEALYWSILQEPKEQNIGISDMQDIAELLSKSTLSPSAEILVSNPRLNEALEILTKINNGEYVDLKTKKLSKQLSSSNPLAIKNSINRLAVDGKFADEVLNSPNNYDEKVVRATLTHVAKTQTLDKYKKHIPQMSMKQIGIMLNRAQSGENVSLSEDIIKQVVDSLSFECQDYVKLASASTKALSPKVSLTLFNSFQQKDEKAEIAYLYLLLEYEMMEQAKEFLDANPENDFKKLKLFYDLKQTHSTYKLQDIMDIDSLCDDA